MLDLGGNQCFGAESFTLALALMRLMTMLDLGRNQLDATGASCRRRKPRRPTERPHF